jgi:hypothetical protein
MALPSTNIAAMNHWRMDYPRCCFGIRLCLKGQEAKAMRIYILHGEITTESHLMTSLHLIGAEPPYRSFVCYYGIDAL